MRAVGTPITLGAVFGAPDTTGAGPHAPGAVGGRDAGARVLPFAAMLATRLVTPPASGRPAAGEHASENEDDRAGESTEPAEELAPPELPPAAATAITPAAIMAPAIMAPTIIPPSTTPSAPSPPATPTAATAATAPIAAPTADVRRVSRDEHALAPALRERLGRVVARMQRDYGHDVRIAEAGRTQARQDYLFSQGRTRSGPVVTWTRDSAHTRGRAVDVTIDGGYDDATAFARLQQIAQAEGLHTLGARDPGHLELPRDVPGEAPVLSLGDGAGTRIAVESFGVRTEAAVVAPPSVAPPSVVPAAVAAVAPVAQVAVVAGVAAVAQVATVAGIATPVASAPAASAPHSPEHKAERDADGDSDAAASRAYPRHARNARATDPVVGLAPRATPRAAESAGGRDEGERAGGPLPDRRGTPHESQSSVSPAVPATASPDASTASPARAVPAAASAAPTPQAAPLLGAVAAERIARVLDAQQAAAPRTVSHLTLRVERAEGGDDRIRLDLRGRAVDARIDVADLGAADRLAARTPELRAALAQRGLTTDDVRVRSAADAALEARGRPEVPAAAATAVDAPRDTTALAAPTLGDGHAGTSAGTSSRDPGARHERQPDDGPPDRTPRDGGAERRGGDQRQGRRPPPDAYLDPRAPAARRAPR